MSVERVFSHGYPNTHVGGLVASWDIHSSEGNIEDSYHIGKISASGRVAGGLVGMFGTPETAYANIKRCYHSGAVSGSMYVGGIHGWRNWGKTEQCFFDGYTGSAEGYGHWGDTPTNTGSFSGSTISDKLKKLGVAFVEDVNNINNGYPILGWESEL